MKVATWNINGVKARLESAVAYLRQASPDVICLQEIKSVDEGFPGAAFEELGYNVAVHGQKGFNGVAKRPAAWTNDALFQPESRAAYRTLVNTGLTDAVRLCHPEPGIYTFWDYQAGAFQKDDGIRIDHLLLSPQAADRLVSAGVDRHVRGWEKPSDHVPVWADLELSA